MRTSLSSRWARCALITVTVMVITMGLLTGAAPAANKADYALCDVRVLYVFSDPETIDWPTLYYLNERYACRIDLVTIRPAGAYRVMTTAVEDREIYMHTVFGRDDDTELTEKITASLFEWRQPDIVILGNMADRPLLSRLGSRLLRQSGAGETVFPIARVYQPVASPPPADDSAITIVINVQELFGRFRERMQLEIPQVCPRFAAESYRPQRLMRYRLMNGMSDDQRGIPDFLSGLRTIRLTSVLDSLLGDGALKKSLVNRGRNFISMFTMGQSASGVQRVRHLVAGYKEMIALNHQAATEPTLGARPEIISYLTDLTQKAQAAVLEEIGLDWEGRIVLRDSPHGPRLKYAASLSVNGPQEVELSYVRFHPYWDSTITVLDSVSRKVAPHQSFVREYLVDIDSRHLEARLPESLTFTAEIVYAQIQLPITTAIPVREMPLLSIAFEPDFHFVPPVARINVDKVVASMNWKAIISKPTNYAGTAIVRLETPRGVFAGAYKTRWDLETGRTTETLRIPFSVSNLFEAGIQSQTISLEVDGRIVATDTGRVRIASCSIADTIKIGFVPDSTGVLEDILRMTDATFQPLTDRSFLTADLDAYNVIVIGSGAFRNYPSLTKVRGRIEHYLRYGGSLVILGQPADWPEGILPVSFVPEHQLVSTADLNNRIPKARLLSQPYKIQEADLQAFFGRPRDVSPAVIAPSERIYVTASGATLLSVSRLGDGQIVYCGLPLLEMVAELNLEAIHLLANILNY